MKINNDWLKNKTSLNDFENKILRSFYSAKLNTDDFFSKKNTIMFGVSGGADSVAMLVAFSEIRKKIFSKNSPRFFVVTIDHSIRPSEESSGDAFFVQELCHKLDVECHIVHFPKGLVMNTASERMKGIEEAARFLRYQAFEQMAKEQNAKFFCLAHNRNDQLETLLMRFLQGSDNSSGSGIPVCRGIFFRPMLDISRQEIEEYLSQKQISYRIDSTNKDETYLRNKIRNKIIPIIDQAVPGWDNAVLSSVEKKIEDNIVLDNLIKKITWDVGVNQNGNPLVSINAKKFFKLLPALRRRFIYKGLSILSVPNRVPYKVIRKVIYSLSDFNNEIIPFEYTSVKVRFCCDGINLYIENLVNNKEDFVKGFYSVIDKEGVYQFPFGKLHAISVDFSNDKNIQNSFPCPVIVRTPLASDCVIDNGKKENLMDFLSSLGVIKEKRHMVPVLEPYNTENVFLIPDYFHLNKESSVCNFPKKENCEEKKYLFIEMIKEDL